MPDNLTLLANYQPAEAEQLQVKLLLVESSDGVAGEFVPHYYPIQPARDRDAWIDAALDVLDAHLVRGVTYKDDRTVQFPPLSPSARQRIKDWAAERWTDEVVERWEAKRAAELAELKRLEAEAIAAREAEAKANEERITAAARALLIEHGLIKPQPVEDDTGEAAAGAKPTGPTADNDGTTADASA